MKKTILKILTWIPAMLILPLIGVGLSLVILLPVIAACLMIITSTVVAAISWPFTKGLDIILRNNKDLHTCADE